MDLSPDWAATLGRMGHDAVHWTDVGAPDAPDDEVLRWVGGERRVVLTSDLEFGAMLATTGASSPSVVQLRTDATLPSRLGPMVGRVLRDTEAELLSGALVTVTGERVRLRSLIFTA